MSNSDWVVVVVGVITAGAQIWSVTFQRQGAIGRIKLIDHQLDLLDRVGELGSPWATEHKMLEVATRLEVVQVFCDCAGGSRNRSLVTGGSLLILVGGLLQVSQNQRALGDGTAVVLTLTVAVVSLVIQRIFLGIVDRRVAGLLDEVRASVPNPQQPPTANG